MKWSEKETLMFVKLYLRHDCLWNYDSECYKMKYKRQKAYLDIIAEFKATTGIVMNESELKVKIKSLRSTYSQELAKIKQRSGPEYKYKPNMKWFSEWHKCFSRLHKKVADEETYDTQEPAEDVEQKIWISQASDNSNGEMEETDPFVTQGGDNFGFILKSEPSESFTTQHRSRSLYAVKKNKIKQRRGSTDNSDETFRSSIDSNLETSVREDEFDIYGKYIASQLRKMDLQQALKAQLDIQSIVSEARLSGLTSELSN